MYSLYKIGRAAVIALTGAVALAALSACGPSANPTYEFSAVANEIPLTGGAVIDVR